MNLFPPDEEKSLSYLLAAAVDQDKVLSLEGLHGFLYCLAVLPELVPPSQWFPHMFGEKMFKFKDEAKGNSLLNELLTLYVRFMEANKNGILRFPFDMGQLTDTEIEQIREWSYGFMRATRLRPAVWSLDEEGQTLPELSADKISEQEELSACVSILLGNAFPEQIPEMLEAGTGTALTAEEIAEHKKKFLALLPNAVTFLQNYAAKQKNK